MKEVKSHVLYYCANPAQPCKGVTKEGGGHRQGDSFLKLPSQLEGLLGMTGTHAIRHSTPGPCLTQTSTINHSRIHPPPRAVSADGSGKAGDLLGTTDV